MGFHVFSIPQRAKALRSKITTAYHRARYFQTARRVLATPPLAVGNEPFTVLSMVHQRDVLPYLVALKSFAHYTRPQRVVVVCDPTIGDAERALFKAHVPHVELRQAEEFRDPAIPQGGTWERLSAISTYSPQGYVVQLDADTVTTGPLPEVLHGVRTGTGFVLGEEEQQQLVTLASAAELAKDWSDRHIQAVAEKNMVRAGLANQQYVRGCSGFTGFPADAQMRDKLFDFSEKMQALVGQRWAEWGTEQVASNYLVANATGTQVLPWPDYATPKGTAEGLRFFHFIGYVRYCSGLYAEVTRAAVAQWNPSKS